MQTDVARHSIRRSTYSPSRNAWGFQLDRALRVRRSRLCHPESQAYGLARDQQMSSEGDSPIQSCEICRPLGCLAAPCSRDDTTGAEELEIRQACQVTLRAAAITLCGLQWWSQDHEIRPLDFRVGTKSWEKVKASLQKEQGTHQQLQCRRGPRRLFGLLPGKRVQVEPLPPRWPGFHDLRTRALDFAPIQAWLLLGALLLAAACKAFLAKFLQRRERMRIQREKRLRVNAKSLSEQRMRMQLALEATAGIPSSQSEKQPVIRPLTAGGSQYEEASWREAETLIPYPGWAVDEIADLHRHAPPQQNHLHLASQNLPSPVIPDTSSMPTLDHEQEHLFMQDEDNHADSAPIEDDADPWQDPSQWDTDIRKQWRDFLNQSKSSKVDLDNWWDIDDVDMRPVGPAIDTDWNR